MKKAIFAVEDDAALQELYFYSLENDFDCRCFDDGEQFFRALPGSLPDLILLDIMLPGDDGFTILTRLKADKLTSLIPVIMVSAKGEEIAKVKGLNLGADDYITKPFGVLELIARIKANLRNNIRAAAEQIIYKNLVVDIAKRQVLVNDKPVQTTLK